MCRPGPVRGRAGGSFPLSPLDPDTKAIPLFFPVDQAVRGVVHQPDQVCHDLGVPHPHLEHLLRVQAGHRSFERQQAEWGNHSDQVELGLCCHAFSFFLLAAQVANPVPVRKKNKRKEIAENSGNSLTGRTKGGEKY
jgi:hypothetical protein